MTGMCRMLGAPTQAGTARRGCAMGPAAYRAAGLPETLEGLGWVVEDLGDAAPCPRPGPVAVPGIASPLVSASAPGGAARNLAEVAAWTRALAARALEMSRGCDLALFLGGDHSMSAGTVAGMAARSAELGQRQFVLWLDAHPDLHTLRTTASGALHGCPVAYFTGRSGFAGFPPLAAAVDPGDVCMMGLRSVDPAERRLIAEVGIDSHDMRALDERGPARPLAAFLDRVAAANGRLHVSLDVDFLDPMIAPAVGTAVPGGATFREAHLIMEMLHDSGLVSSLDLAELNPFLDERGRTALLMTDLASSLCGRRILDRAMGA
ncbi:MAG: arginase [Pseudomonadota bacterium]|nr:arginase [Pseudomonadota bacterium]